MPIRKNSFPNQGERLGYEFFLLLWHLELRRRDGSEKKYGDHHWTRLAACFHHIRKRNLGLPSECIQNGCA